MKTLAQRLLIATFITVALASIFTPSDSTQAHAVLVRSFPGSQAKLLTAPASIDLWFSEPLEAQFSSFELFSSSGQPLPIDGLRIDPTDTQRLSGLTRGMDSGIYTVIYRTLSTRDGHEWSGSFTFSVLNKDGSPPIDTAFAPNISGGTSLPLVLGRWFTFIGFSVLLGGGLIWIFTSDRPWKDRDELLPQIAAKTYKRLALSSLLLVVTGGYLQIESTRNLLGASFTDLLGNSHFGTLLLWRSFALFAMGIALALGFAAARSRHLKIEISASVLIPVFASIGLLTVALLSHATAAPGSFWAVLIDFTHLTLSALWVGGVIVLGVLFVNIRRHPQHDEIPLLKPLIRFSIFSAVAIYLLAMTGILRALGELPTVDTLFGTEYGRWLLLKLALLSPLLGVALLNRSLLNRWSRGEIAEKIARHRISRLLLIESALAMTLLATVAILGQVPTPQGIEPSPTNAFTLPYNRIEQTDGLNVHLQINPASVGTNELRVHIYRPGSSNPEAIRRVQLILSAEGFGGGDTLLTEPQGDGIFTATSILSSSSRIWNVDVDIRRDGFDDLRPSFKVPIEAVTSDSRDGTYTSIAPQLTTNELWALLLLAVGLGLLIWKRTTPGMHGTITRASSMGVLLIALLLVISAERHGTGLSLLKNPNPSDPVAAARGQALYSANCTTCHGLTGRGDGPSAASLNPPPADLTLHVPLHPESDTYIFIARGFPGTAMPAWEEQLTEQQIWDLVNYLRREFGDMKLP